MTASQWKTPSSQPKNAREVWSNKKPLSHSLQPRCCLVHHELKWALSLTWYLGGLGIKTVNFSRLQLSFETFWIKVYTKLHLAFHIKHSPFRPICKNCNLSVNYSKVFSNNVCTNLLIHNDAIYYVEFDRCGKAVLNKLCKMQQKQRIVL